MSGLFNSKRKAWVEISRFGTVSGVRRLGLTKLDALDHDETRLLKRMHSRNHRDRDYVLRYCYAVSFQPLTALVQDVIRAAPAPPPPTPSVDWITAMLTAVGVIAAFGGIILGASALFMGYLAYYGKRDIIEEAKKIAQKAAEEYLEKNEQIADMYKQRVPVSATIAPVIAASNELEEEGAASPIAEPLPEGEKDGD